MTTREQYLAELANAHGWKTGVELGVKFGRVMFYLLEQCPGLSMLGVDLWEEQPDNPGLETYVGWPHREYEAICQRRTMDFPGRAMLLKKHTVDAAMAFADKWFDFVFIDADHSYAAVMADIRAWTSKVKPGGAIIGHDIDWVGVRQAVREQFQSNVEIGADNVWLVWRG